MSNRLTKRELEAATEALRARLAGEYDVEDDCGFSREDAERALGKLEQRISSLIRGGPR